MAGKLPVKVEIILEKLKNILYKSQNRSLVGDYQNNNDRRRTGMAKAKKGDLLSCELCGLVVSVDEVGGMGIAELLCCKSPMGKGKAAAAKARKKAAMKAPKAEAIKKEVKAAAKAAPVKAKSAPKKEAKKADVKAPAKKAAAPVKKAAAPVKEKVAAKKPAAPKKK